MLMLTKDSKHGSRIQKIHLKIFFFLVYRIEKQRDQKCQEAQNKSLWRRRRFSSVSQPKTHSTTSFRSRNDISLKFRVITWFSLPSSINQSISWKHLGASQILKKTLNQKSRSMASFARRAMSLAHQIPSARVSPGASSIGQRRCLAGAAGNSPFFSFRHLLWIYICFGINFRTHSLFRTLYV